MREKRCLKRNKGEKEKVEKTRRGREAEKTER